MQLSNETSPAPTGLSERILGTLNSSIICVDARRKITYINSAGEALFESSATGLIGRDFAGLLSELAVDMGDHTLTLQLLERAVIEEPPMLIRDGGVNQRAGARTRPPALPDQFCVSRAGLSPFRT